VHRDLKPENVLLETEMRKNSTSDDIAIKIIDFGTSSLITHGKSLNKRIGTSYYVAPEVLNGKYDHRCDLWSIGIITYILLCGYPPFNGGNDTEILAKVNKMHYVFREEDWSHMSNNAKSLISLMLKPVAQRISA
jgi:calcium-dependent protein kinase